MLYFQTLLCILKILYMSLVEATNWLQAPEVYVKLEYHCPS